MTNEPQNRSGKPLAYYYEVFFDARDPQAIVTVSKDVKGFDEHRLLKAEPIQDWPENVVFVVEGDHAEDYLVSAVFWELVSERAKNALEACEITGVQFLPARVIKSTGEAVGTYWVMNVLQAVQGLDWSHTRWSTPKAEDSKEPWWDIRRFALLAEAVAGVDIFRLDIRGYLTVEEFISDRVYSCLRRAGATSGFDFTPVPAYGTGDFKDDRSVGQR